MTTDDAVRDALEHLAQHAPDPDRVLLRLAGHARVRRQRRALTLAGGVVAAGAAVGTPLMLLGDRHVAAPASPSGPSTMPSPSPSPGNDRIPMRYRPTWLPDEMVEISRAVGAHDPEDASDQQIRTWRNDASGQEVQLEVAGRDSVDVTGLRRITVHGVSGWVDERAGRPSVAVIWPAGPGRLIQVTVQEIAPKSTTLPLRIANSVTPDGTSVLEMPVALGWLPDGVHRHADSLIQATPHGWRAMVSADDGKAPGERVVVSATVGTAADVLPSSSKSGTTNAPRTVTVRGVTAAFLTPQILLVPLSGRLALRVGGNASRPDLIRVADALRIGPVPDLTWLGIR
jgi:hypothetical protein